MTKFRKLYICGHYESIEVSYKFIIKVIKQIKFMKILMPGPIPLH